MKLYQKLFLCREGGVPDASFDIFLAGKNRHTLPVFNPRLTSLNHFLLPAAVILTYICQSPEGQLHQQGVIMEPPSPPPPPLHVPKLVLQYFLQKCRFWLEKVNLDHFCWIVSCPTHIVHKKI